MKKLPKVLSPKRGPSPPMPSGVFALGQSPIGPIARREKLIGAPIPALLARKTRGPGLTVHGPKGAQKRSLP